MCGLGETKTLLDLCPQTDTLKLHYETLKLIFTLLIFSAYAVHTMDLRILLLNLISFKLTESYDNFLIN